MTNDKCMNDKTVIIIDESLMSFPDSPKARCLSLPSRIVARLKPHSLPNAAWTQMAHTCGCCHSCHNGVCVWFGGGRFTAIL